MNSWIEPNIMKENVKMNLNLTITKYQFAMLLNVPVNVIEMQDVLTSVTTTVMPTVLIIYIVTSSHLVIWTIFETKAVPGFLDLQHTVHVSHIIPVLLYYHFLDFPDDCFKHEKGLYPSSDLILNFYR